MSGWKGWEKAPVWRKLRDLEISAASGLVRHAGSFYAVADDELRLCELSEGAGADATVCRLLPGELPEDYSARKSLKPDFESLALIPGSPSGALLVVPSGSTARRMTGARVPLAVGSVLADGVRPVSFAALYGAIAERLERETGLGCGDLNIEGAAVAGERLWLLQRGNGAGGVNAAIELDLARVREGLAAEVLSPACLMSVRAHDLGRLSGSALGFTDAAPWGDDGSLIFVAAAESGGSTYHDGKCAGSVIGTIDSLGRLGAMHLISTSVKAEGVWVEREGSRAQLWIVTDADDRARAAELFGAEL